MTGRTLAFTATFFVPVVLARVFSQAEFGTYKQLFLLFATFNAVAQFGMSESLFYFVPLAPRSAGRHVANSLLFLAASGLGCLALLAATRAELSHWLSNSALGAYLPLLGVFLLLMLVASALEIVMITGGRYLLASSSNGVSDVLRAAFLVVPVLLGPGIESLLLGAVAFATLRLVAALAYLGRVFGHDFRPHVGLFRSQVAYAAPFAGYVLFDIFQSTFHQYVVSYHFDAATFAVYAVGCLQIPLVDFLSTSAGNVMMVRMGEAIRDGRRDALLGIWHDTSRQLALILVPVVGLLLVTAHPLIVLFFTELYSASVPIFMTGSTSILLAVLVTDSVLRVYAETRFLLLRNGARALLVVLLIHASMSTIGLPGAVLVTVLATLAGKALDLARLRALFGVNFVDLMPWQTLAAILGAAAAAGLASRAVTASIDLPPLLEVSAGTIVYAGTYLAALLRFGLLTESEKRAIASRLWECVGGLGWADAREPGARRLPPTD